MSAPRVKRNRGGSASYPGGARYGRTPRPGDDIERGAPERSPGFEDELEGADDDIYVSAGPRRDKQK